MVKEAILAPEQARPRSVPRRRRTGVLAEAFMAVSYWVSDHAGGPGHERVLRAYITSASRIGASTRFAQWPHPTLPATVTRDVGSSTRTDISTRRTGRFSGPT